MEMEDLLISTGVDSLIRLVKEKNRVELLMAAKLLNLPQTTVEDWAHVLEEEGIIKIDYQLTKIYLLWVVPTTEQMEKSRESFRRRKTSTEEELSKLDGIQEKGRGELKQYSEAIEQISKKFEEDFAKVESLSAQLEALKGRKAQVSRASMEKVDSLDSKLGEIESSVRDLEAQLGKTGKGFDRSEIESKLKNVEGAKKHIKSLGKDFSKLVSKVDRLREKAPKGDVELGNIKSGFDSLKGEFRRLNEESEYINSMISEFKANADTITEALSHIRELSKSAESTRDRLKEEYDSIEKLKAELPELEKQIVEDLEIADQYSDTISIAQEVLENVPTKEDILKRMSALEKDEKRAAEEFKRIEAALSGVTGDVLSVGELMDELEDMKAGIEDARARLSEDADDILSSIEEETATYETFQKIKSKTKTAIDAYLAQLAKIRKESTSIREDLAGLKKESDKSMEEIAGEATPESMSNAVELISQLKQKREELKKIRELIADLNSRSGMIEKNIKLLSKEAKLIALRGEGMSSGGGEKGASGPRKGDVGEKVSLTAQEQEEFEFKRKELKSLIRKLWESD